MYRLDNPVQHYAWGSHTDLATLRGDVTPSVLPEAELWMGAHPQAPSSIVVDGETAPLDRLIASDPETWLGAHPLPAYRGELPFLVKLLAASRPLSLQTHPDAAQALEGFSAEDAAGIPLDAPHRNYRDRHPKPELLYALTPFEALCGFRPVAELRAIFEASTMSALAPVGAALGAFPNPRQAFSILMNTALPQRPALVASTLVACECHADDPGPVGDASRIVLRLARFFPEDIGLVGALMLRHWRLDVGQALFMGSGQLHSYIEGLGLEVMANSDNVLRGGFTGKHVDVPELLRVLDFDAPAVELITPRPEAPGRVLLETPTEEFALHALDLGETAMVFHPHGPEILLCVHGRVHAHSSLGTVELGPTHSAIVPAATSTYHVHGHGLAFRVTIGRPLHA